MTATIECLLPDQDQPEMDTMAPIFADLERMRAYALQWLAGSRSRP
jgi:hypothetical protein